MSSLLPRGAQEVAFDLTLPCFATTLNSWCDEDGLEKTDKGPKKVVNHVQDIFTPNPSDDEKEAMKT